MATEPNEPRREAAPPAPPTARASRAATFGEFSEEHLNERTFGFLSLLSPCRPFGALNPRNLLLPLDHQQQFNLAVGAAKGNEALKVHVITLLNSWSIVSTLIFGAALAMIPMPDEAQPVDEALVPVFKFLCMLACLCSLLGPVILGSVLMNNCHACGTANFDVFYRTCSPAFMFNELMVTSMCYSLIFATTMLPWVMQPNLVAASVFTGIALVLLFLILVPLINLVSAVNIYGGLLLERRAIPDKDVFAFSSARDQSLFARVTHDHGRRLLLDAVVKNILSRGTAEHNLQSYSKTILKDRETECGAATENAPSADVQIAFT